MGGARLDDLIRAQLSAFGMEKVTCHGDKIVLRAEAVQNVALALHELATNASKYGSLSNSEGKIDISWQFVNHDGKARSLRLTWHETGGPPVVAPTRKGFGCFVLDRVTGTRLARAASNSIQTG